MRKHLRIWFWLRNVMRLRSAINITHIPEEQVAYRQCTRPSLPPAKAWLREATCTHARMTSGGGILARTIFFRARIPPATCHTRMRAHVGKIRLARETRFWGRGPRISYQTSLPVWVGRLGVRRPGLNIR